MLIISERCPRYTLRAASGTRSAVTANAGCPWYTLHAASGTTNAGRVILTEAERIVRIVPRPVRILQIQMLNLLNSIAFQELIDCFKMFDHTLILEFEYFACQSFYEGAVV